MASATSRSFLYGQQEIYAPSSIPSLPTTAQNCTGWEKTFIFSSEWVFRPDGITVVKEKFELDLATKGLAAHVEWNDDTHSFQIFCSGEQQAQIWGSFFKVVDAVIKQETADSWDSDSESGMEDPDDDGSPAEKSLIKSLSAWKRENCITENNDADLDCNQLEDESLQQIPSPEFPKEVIPFGQKAIWEYKDTQPSLDNIVPDKILERLAMLSGLEGCIFSKDRNQGKIYIGSSTEEQCQVAIAKLDTIRKNSVLKSPYAKHLFYSEDVEKYQVSFKYFVDVKKKFFETTLLDNLRWSPNPFEKYSKLPLAVTVRCSLFHHQSACFVPFQIGKFTAAVGIDDKTSTLREWNGYKYNSYIFEGQTEENSMTRYLKYKKREQLGYKEAVQQSHEIAEITEMDPEAVESPTQADIIHRWASQVPQGPIMSNSEKNSSGLEACSNFGQKGQTPGRNARWDTYNEYKPKQDNRLDQKPNYNQYARLNTSLVDLLRSTEASESTFGLALSGTGPQSPMPKEFANKPITPLEVANDVLDFFQESPRNIVPVLPALQPASPPLQDMISFTVMNTKNNPLHEPLPKITTPVFTTTTTTTAILNEGSEDLMSFEDSSGHPLDDNISMLEFDVLQPAGTKRASHLETLQPVSEVASRTFHSTMSQKAPKPKKGVPNSNHFPAQLPLPSPPRPRHMTTSIEKTITTLPEFTMELESSFSTLIQSLNGFQGEVIVQAEIGRLLLQGIHSKYITSKDSGKSYDAEELLNILQISAGKTPKTFFTNVVTTLPADIIHLIQMKDVKGDTIWESNQSKWNVLYEFICLDNREQRYNPFAVEIDGERFDLGSKVKIERNLGSINVHGAKRHWDFRIAATGIQICEKDHAYEELSNSIMRNLCIVGGSSDPLIYFEIEDSLSYFDILGVRIRRTSQYNSQAGESTLKVSEVTELDLDYVHGDGRRLGKAVRAASPRNGLDWLDSWYEVSISSAKVDTIFEQNKLLELGDEVPWKLDKVYEIGAAQAIYLPTCEMIRQMDGIGFYNDNGFEVPEKVASANLEPEPENTSYFW